MAKSNKKAPEGATEKSTQVTAQRGNLVSVNYTGKLTDGSIFDTSEGREPIQFTIGGNQVIPAFESSVIGKPEGFKTTISINAENAYGQVRPELIVKVPINSVPQGVSVGQVLYAVDPNQPQGQQIACSVIEVNSDHVVIDANHPLAGKDLTFDIELVKIA